MGLLPLILLIPFVEIGGFVLLGPYLGLGGTFAEIILTGVIGLAVIRRQGFETLRRLQAVSKDGDTPLPVAVEGGIHVMAGVLLAVPGFFTDMLGLLLLVAPIRRLVTSIVIRRMRRGQETKPSTGPTVRVIDAEYEIITPDVRPTHRNDQT